MTLIQKIVESYKETVPALRLKNSSHGEYPAWRSIRLGIIGDTYGGLSGKSAKDFGEGRPFITYKQVFDKSSIDITKCGAVKIHDSEKQNSVSFGDIIFTTSSETASEVGLSSAVLDDLDNTYLNSFCFGFRPKSLDELNPLFAKYLFRAPTFRKNIVYLAQGSTRYNISKKGFKKISVALPCREEQREIAQFLSAIDTKIDALVAKKAALEEYKRGLMQKLFSQEIRFTREDGSAYPDWTRKKISDVADVLTGKSVPAANISTEPTNMAIMRGANIGRGFVDFANSKCRWLAETVQSGEKYACRENDVVLGMDGNAGENIAKLSEEQNRYFLIQRVCRIRADSEPLAEFIFQILLTDMFKEYVRTVGVGSTIFHISKEDIASFEVMFPTAEEISKIGSFMASIDRSISAVSVQIETFSTYKTGLLQKMFV